jgi:hypothetical protein
VSSSFKPAFSKWGRKCLGPKALSGRAFVQEIYPWNSVLGFNTAKINTTYARELDFDPRCLLCYGELRLNQKLQKRGWTTGDDDPTQQCDYAGCKALRKPFTIYCLLHILYPNKIQRYSTKTEEARATQVINKSMNRSWEVDRSSNFEKYLNRKSTVARVIAVDVEGRMAQGILTQITAIEAESCNNIFNIRISNLFADKQG